MRMIRAEGRNIKPGRSHGTKPRHEWLSIACLRIDDRYQRPLLKRSWRAIERIAANFHWPYFTTVQVADLKDGTYAVMDGQHRVHAALLAGHDKVPCQIADIDLAEQASAFAAINGAVVNVTTWSILKAGIVAGDPVAVAARDACAEAGCTLMTANSSASEKQPGEIYCNRYILGLIEAKKRKEMTFALSILKQSACGQDVDAWQAAFLRGWCDALIERYPRLGRRPLADLVEAAGLIDASRLLESVGDTMRALKRSGGVVPGKFELARADIGTHFDRHFVDRVGLPAPDPAPEREAAE